MNLEPLELETPAPARRLRRDKRSPLPSWAMTPAPRPRRAQARFALEADDDPVFAAGRKTPKGYRNARRALAAAVAEAKIPVADRPSGSRRTRSGTPTRRT